MAGPPKHSAEPPDPAARGRTREAARCDGTPLALGAVAIAIAAWAVAQVASTTGLIITGVALLTALQVVVMRRAAGGTFVYASLLVIVLNVVGTLGYLYYRGLAFEAAVSAVLPSDDVTYNRAAAIFATFSVVFTGGSVVTSVVSQRASWHRPAAANTFQDTGEALQRLIGRPVLFWSIVLTPLLMLVLGYSPSGLLHRGRYLQFGGPVLLVVIGTVIAPVAFALAATLVFTGTAFTLRVRGGVIAAAYLAVLFAMGTRGLALYPVLIVFAWLVGGGWQRKARAVGWAAFSLFASTWLLSIVLTLRFRSGAGWAPYLSHLAAEPRVLTEIDLPALSGNILFSVPLAGTVAVLKPLPESLLWTSLTPLPSSLTDWSTAHLIVSLNPSTPYNGLGELLAYGVLALVGVAFCAGAMITGLQLWNAGLPLIPRVVTWLLGIGLTGALSLDLLQYNLRSGMRVIWYLLVLSLALHAVKRFGPPDQTGAHAPSPVPDHVTPVHSS